ncbi:hypothetical protein HPB48_000595 [Haemaphysalis longicornis]|uniref:HTH CENPB-type domain-containing protein n=1 Tax=Haemaphysalis longicornis TaxID=44386 RepID=A0A9J6FX83_HAELO|nr:hypothetical protein HPB48_000595 [Haemaphysalis longicornis]
MGVFEDVLGHVRHLRKAGCVVSYAMIRTHAQACAWKRGITSTAFITINGWTASFRWRNGLRFRRRTSLRQRLLPRYEEEVVDFHKFAICLWQDREFVPSQIGNANQTSINSDLSMNRTVEQRKECSVLNTMTSAEKQSFTVMLPITADGSKFPHT